jgi:ParB family chromosome partitioning protein
MAAELSYIAEGLRGLAVGIDEVHEDPANVRTGHAVDRIGASLRQYGQRKPIVANRLEGGKVEAGNGTLRAARALGWSHIAVVWVEDSPAAAAGFGIADNRVGDLSRWDVEGLGELLQALDPDEVYSGFDASEIATLLEASGGPGENGFEYAPQWAVTVMCASEDEQESVYNDLTARGLKCRVVTV